MQDFAAWKYHAPHDWAVEPMGALPALLMFAADLWVWSLYYTEREAARHAHKKYIAHSTLNVVAIHFVAGVTETILGLLYCLGKGDWYATSAAYVALFLHIPTGFYLSPKVWGLKHITIPGYLMVNTCRLLQALRVLNEPHRLPDLWILLHMATLVRICSIYITPYSSTDGGRRGDLVTDQIVYTLSVSLAALCTLNFVYPPIVSLGALIICALLHKIYPSSVPSRYPALVHKARKSGGSISRSRSRSKK